jgi:hypothetical protein
VLPFIRARYGLPQAPACPLVTFPPFSLRELSSGPSARPKPLQLSMSDVRTVEEWAKTKAKLEEMREKQGIKKPADGPATTEGDPKKPGELAVTEIAADPANYGPVTVAGVGTAEAPLIEPPATDGKLLTRPAVEALSDRRRKATEDKERRDKAAEIGGRDNASSLDNQLAELETLYSVTPTTNGKHPVKKGGSK